MYYVYLIQSINFPTKTYVGFTTNLNQRLKVHNSGNCASTEDLGPWELITCLVFKNMKKAKEFEKYLKSHSGRAFIHKRLM